VDEQTTHPTSSPTTPAGWRSDPVVAPRHFFGDTGPVAELARAPARLVPPSGWHWKIFTACGPLMIVIGVPLRWFGDVETGTFIAVVGACVLFTHLYMRFCALDAVDGFHTFPGS
jgi:hypothetical protein